MRTALAAALISACGASAQDFPDAPRRPPVLKTDPSKVPPPASGADFDEPARPVAKTSASPTPKCPEGPPEAILKYMEQSLQVTADESNPVEVRQAYRTAFDGILAAGDKILQNASATENQKNEAYQYQASILYQGAKKGELGFAQKLDQLAARLYLNKPKSDVANLANFLSVKARYEEEDGLRYDALPAVMEYLKKYPREEAAIELLFEVAHDAEADGRREIAKEAVIEVQKRFKKHEIAARIPAVLERLDLVGKKLNLELPLMDGKRFVSSDRKRIVAIAFWATWSETWPADQAILKELYSRYKSEGLEVVGIPLDEKERVVEDYVNKNQISWPQGIIPVSPSDQGHNHPVAKKYGIMQVPTIMLVEDGKVVATQIRGRALRTKIEDLVGKGAAPSRLIGDLPEKPPLK
jgi:thiol-disulfide isomerase/thioredoxin